MKSITIFGNIGKDAVARTTQSGQSVTSWTVAVEHRAGSEKSTIWFDVSMWGKRGEGLAQYLTKGGKVAVSGDFSTRMHDGKTYLQVNANDVSLGGSASGQSGGNYQAPASGGTGGAGGINDDQDIPFAPETRA